MTNYTTASTIYISQTEGKDWYSGLAPTYDGFANGPVKSLTKALALIDYIRANNIYHHLTVSFIGDYYLETEISLGGEHIEPRCSANTKIRDITFTSFGKERSKIIGGKRLEGFKTDNFNGVDCFSLYIPEVKEKGWKFSDLYLGDRRLNIARHPQNSTLKAVDTEQNTFKYSLNGSSKWFIAHKEDLEGIDDIENASVSFFHFWIDEHSPVESYDKESGKLTLSYRSIFPITANYNGTTDHIDIKYYLENVAKGFGGEDSWYLDVKNGMLYVKLADNSVKAEDVILYAPTMSQLVKIEGTPENKVSGIRFTNLDFLCSKGDYCYMTANRLTGEIEPHAANVQSYHEGKASVIFKYAENCSVRNCNLYCLGFHAVEIGHGSQGIRIEDCEIYENGGSAVKLIGNSVDEAAEKSCKYNVIRGNYIHHCARRYICSCGIIAMHTSHNEISDNEICHLDYSGISVGWVWGFDDSTTRCNLIRGNHIHHIGYGELSDMGAIYTLGKQDGTVIEENNLHDIKARHYGAYTLHIDEGSSYILIENNLLHGEKQGCINLTDGIGNVARKNVFAFSTDDALVRAAWFCGGTGIIFEENDFITDGTAVFGSEKNGEIPTNLHNITAASDNNRFWDLKNREPIMCGEGEKAMDLENWKKVYGNDINSRVEEPKDLIIDGKNVIKK